MSEYTIWAPVAMIPALPGTRALYVSEESPGSWYCLPVITWALVEQMREDDYGRLDGSARQGYRSREIVAMVLSTSDHLKRAAERDDEDGERFQYILEPDESTPDPSDIKRWQAAINQMRRLEEIRAHRRAESSA